METVNVTIRAQKSKLVSICLDGKNDVNWFVHVIQADTAIASIGIGKRRHSSCAIGKDK